jgi:glycosyltransferase involved in cell wall biosynthesis
VSGQTIGAGGDRERGETRSVLLVTYYFPPSGGPGVQRMLKFTKYLPHFGWKPVVLTVREDAEYPVRDPSLWKDVPEGTRILRTGITEFYRLYRGIAKPADPLDISTRSRQGGLVQGLLRKIRAGVFIPDGRVGWIPHALGPGRKLARGEGVRAILSSGPPFTTHLIGGTISRRTGLPWVADFRDPWTRAPFYPDRGGLARMIDERCERWVVRNATRTIAVNREILADFIDRYRGLDASRLITLSNGFDEEDFEGIAREEPPKMTLVHTGSLFASRDPQELREALSALCREEEGFAGGVDLILAGRVDREVVEAFRTPPLDRIVRAIGYLEHGESLRLLRRAHLCLVFVGEESQSRGMLTGKVFEYLGSGTAVLALAPEGEAAELIRRCRAGYTLAPGDAAGLKELLRSLWRRYRSGERRFAQPDPEAVAQYGRRRLTERLASILEAISGPARMGPDASITA